VIYVNISIFNGKNKNKKIFYQTLNQSKTKLFKMFFFFKFVIFITILQVLHCSLQWDYKELKELNGIPNLDTSCKEKELYSHIVNEYQDKNYSLCLRKYPDIIANSIEKYGIWHDCKILVQIWFFLIKHYKNYNSYFVDIGANIGACSILMSSYDIKVISFEPHPSNLYYFTKSILLNHDKDRTEIANLIQLYPIGLGERRDQVVIFSQKGNFGNSMIDNPIADGGSNIEIQNSMKLFNTTVDVYSLDEVLMDKQGYSLNILNNDKNITNNSKSLINKRNDIILLMKIDVQGYEPKVLNGAGNLLSSGSVKYIISEIDPQRLQSQGSNSVEFCKKLENYGFELVGKANKSNGKSLSFQEYGKMLDSYDGNRINLVDEFIAKYKTAPNLNFIETLYDNVQERNNMNIFINNLEKTNRMTSNRGSNHNMKIMNHFKEIKKMKDKSKRRDLPFTDYTLLSSLTLKNT
jgi:FkbM family methyltransferase